jgi:hypothetical protein
MPYVQRDVSGQISVIYKEPQEGAGEYLPNNHPDLQNFFGGIVPQTGPDQASAHLNETDANLIRVIEDIVDIMIEKNLIMFTDLPPAAREKIMQRKSTREHFLGNSSLVESEDKLF